MIKSITITVGAKPLVPYTHGLPAAPFVPTEDISEKVTKFLNDNNIEDIVNINYKDRFTCYLTYKEPKKQKTKK